MKVLYIITSADGGGAQKYVLDLAHKFNGSIAAGVQGKELFENADKLQIQTHPLKHLKRNINPWHDLLAIWEIYSLIRKENPDLVHLNSSKAGFLGSIAGKFAGVKVVFTAHGFFYFERSPWLIKITYTFLERLASMCRNLIITVSEEDRKQALDHHLISPSKIKTIYNGIPITSFLNKLEAKKILGLGEQILLLGNIAQLYDRKDIVTLIKAVDLFPENLKEQTNTVVIGEGPDRQQFEQLINEKGLGHIFSLPGYKPDASNLLKAFDIFVLSSKREGFPYVILEAMSAGLPIIATDVGGVKEALGDAGILVPPEDPAKLAEAIINLINNPDLRESLATKALERSQNFTQEKMFEETEKVYQKLLSQQILQ
ncbi:MAG: glycosyltransferase family 4 protein [Candidatus Doudnabacteria bacterium]|jgi:glycosyltransferase involved in cell wall biosynthesis